MQDGGEGFIFVPKQAWKPEGTKSRVAQVV